MNEVISIIVPTYNERDNIVPLVKQIARTLDKHDYEIIFVDDDSSDGTAELAATLFSEYPVKVIIRREERGLASAVVEGFKHVSGQIIGVMDADLQHPPEVLLGLVESIENNADIAIASRYVEGGGCQGWGLTRRIISRGAIFIAHLLLPSTRTIKDPVSGFFMFRKTIIDGVNLKPTGYKILLEILMEGNFQRISEVAYIFKARISGESKLNIREQVDYLLHIFTLMKRKGELLRFVKFCLVGLSGVGVNLGLLWLLTDIVGLFYLISAAISVESSIISNFILNNAFTFHDRITDESGTLLNRLVKFNLVSLTGLGINLGILWLLTEVLGLYYLVSEVIAIVITTMWNYLLSTWWVWEK